MPVMQEGATPHREILPGSSWPGLVSQGLAVRSWQSGRNRVTEDHVTTESGLWLPSANSSIIDFKESEKYAQRHHHKPALRYMGEISLTETGCWNYEGQDRGAVIALAEVDNPNAILEPIGILPLLRLCDNESCIYHRHYDMTRGVPSGRRALLAPNLDYFTEEPGDGDILTAWGDRLPNPQISRQRLMALQRLSLPYVPADETLLTSSGISQITLLPETGCWMVRSYYMTPNGVEYKWQYDAYGRLQLPEYPRRLKINENFPRGQVLGHRAVWAALGNKRNYGEVLNHMCGYRPCANPDHLEQVSSSYNNVHGAVASGIIKAAEAGEDPASITKFFGKRLPAHRRHDFELFWHDRVISLADSNGV